MENSKNNWLAFALCALAYTFSGVVSTLMSVYLPVAIPDLLGGTATESQLGAIGAYINAIFLYGWMVGGLLFGVLSDRIGRKTVLVIVTALYGSSTILCVFVPNPYILMVLRFFAGMGIGGVLLVTTVYISEVWKVKNRPVILGLLAICFPIGIVTSGGLNILIPIWRDAFWLGLMPVFIAFLISLFLPETTAWESIKKDKTLEKSLFDTVYRANLLRGTIIFGSVLIGLWGRVSKARHKELSFIENQNSF